MIRLTESLPQIDTASAELIKIYSNYNCYKGDKIAMFWVQNEADAIIGMVENSMTIYNNHADITELKEFVTVLSPSCIFTDSDTMRSLKTDSCEEVFVMSVKSDISGDVLSHKLNSREIYDLLNKDGLSLPAYEYFAVDYCRRINHGLADFYAITKKCAAISFKTDNYAILNGIASHEKGFGGQALEAILKKNFGRTVIACCRENVKGFYEKYGFKQLYKAAYWVKSE